MSGGGGGSGVTDEEAMQALLSSAEARLRERQNASDGRSHGKGGRNNQHDHDRNKRLRFSADRNSTNGSNEHSYYGPNENEDRKRHRPDNQRLRERDRETVPCIEPEDDQDKEEGSNRNTDNDKEENHKPQYKPNFGLSGALSKDVQSGNMYKFKEPPEARAPNTQWRFYVFKRGQKDVIETLHISKQSAYLMGRNADIADIPMHHPSLSSQHAVLQFRALPNAQGRLLCQPYILDLESTNGTFLNGIKIDAARYYQLKKGDVLTFGASTREYVLLTENTTSA
jgi:smad nuclear-interacting protein 1